VNHRDIVKIRLSDVVVVKVRIGLSMTFAAIALRFPGRLLRLYLSGYRDETDLSIIRLYIGCTANRIDHFIRVSHRARFSIMYELDQLIGRSIREGIIQFRSVSCRKAKNLFLWLSGWKPPKTLRTV